MINKIEIDSIMEKTFEKMYSATIVKELIAENVTDYERGKIAGKIEMLNHIAMELNPKKEDEEDEDEADIVH